MGYKYLYIDDNTAENVKGIIVGLEKEGELSIAFRNPADNWESERDDILSKSFSEYDGLVIDLNLEENPNQSKIYSKYKGSSLAQEIRNISRANEMKEIPIVLLSATVNINRYFDKTNEDLFDLVIRRDQLTDVYIPIRKKLIALAEGYKAINLHKGKINFDELFLTSFDREDIRILDQLETLVGFPTHAISKFIVKNLLDRNGPLITEKLLAVRLGIDIQESKDWSKLLADIKFNYQGVFHIGWDRWWMSGLESWWKDNFSDLNLRTTPGEVKVEKLKEKTGFTNLIAIVKSEKSKSSSFWTTCVGTGVPIDTVDGLIIAGQDNIFPWQDRQYVSIDEALKPKAKNKWNEIAAIEQPKLSHLKKLYPNVRPNS